MCSVSASTAEAGDATLVHVTVTAERARTVRVEPTGDATVWPPRRRGVPAQGWDQGGFTGEVSPAGPLVLGFATPATLDADDPVTVERVDVAGAGENRTATDLVRSLGDPRPPRDAVVDSAGQPSGDGDATRDRPPLDAVPVAVTDWLADLRGRRAVDVASPASDTGLPPAATLRWIADECERLADAAGAR